MIGKNYFTFVICVLLFSCTSQQNTTSLDKKKDKWKASIVHSEELYQTITSQPISEKMVENSVNSEAQAKIEMAMKIFETKDLSNSFLFGGEIIDARKIETLKRSQIKVLADGISNMKLDDDFKSSEEYLAAYSIDKQEYNETNESKKNNAIEAALKRYNEAFNFSQSREPQLAADELSLALIELQAFLFEELLVDMDGESKRIDQLIFEEMQSLRESLSLKTEPEESIALNRENEYSSILDFEVLQNSSKAGKINVSIDVAGMRNENILVNGYSILVADLPPRLNKSYVTIRCDLFSKLRVDGNGIVQLIYQKLTPLQKQVKIDKKYPALKLSKLEVADSWSKQAKKLFVSEFKKEITLDESIDDAIEINPTIIYSEKELGGQFRVTGQWKIQLAGMSKVINSEKIVITKSSVEIAKNELINKLNTQLQKKVKYKLFELLEEL